VNKNFLNIILVLINIGIIVTPVSAINNSQSTLYINLLNDVWIAINDLQNQITGTNSLQSGTDDLQMQWLHGAENFTDKRSRGRSVKPE